MRLIADLCKFKIKKTIIILLHLSTKNEQKFIFQVVKIYLLSKIFIFNY